MTNILLAARDGGGTAAVEIRVARRLVEHGHHVRVIGTRGVCDAAAGLDVTLVKDAEPAALATRLLDELDGIEIVVADCMLYGALIAATVRGVPSVALMPTVYLADRLAGSKLATQPHWTRVRENINTARSRFGLPPITSVGDQILESTKVLVLTSRAFELPDVQPPPHVVYVGPQLDDAQDWNPPEASNPLVLVSLSTSDQGQDDLLQRLLTALGRLPVHALVTVGPAVDPATLDAPDNVTVERFLPHSSVLPHAALVVTHAGHGTVLSALRAGVPLVCIPMGRDQYDVTERVRHHGAGISLPDDADILRLADGISSVLAEPKFTSAARRLAAMIADQDPNQVVEEIVGTQRGIHGIHARGAGAGGATRAAGAAAGWARN
ncbi:MAG TPA: glycosyltransferase [Mycobacteriales bacterium]|nr:glycosyltransferase [Mycobacteriales bacterium]